MGKLFVIEGTDCSGKQTQLEKLKQRFIEEGIDFRTVSFPNYDSPSSELVKMYLSGEFGTDPKSISAYIASTFYAADRYATFKKDLEEYYNNGGIILADRYTTSNMVHQSGKIKDQVERKKFLDWLWDFEFNLYKLPIPTKTFFLNMPTDVAVELMKNRENKFTHESKKDIHERDISHLRDSYEAACQLVNDYDWYEVNCVKEGTLRTIEDIHQEIFNKISEFMKIEE